MVSTIKTTDKTKSVFDQTQQALKMLEVGDKFDQDESVLFLCRFYIEAKGLEFSTDPGKIVFQAHELKKSKDDQRGIVDLEEVTDSLIGTGVA